LKELLIKYAALNKELKRYGGRNTIGTNLFLEDFYEEISDTEEDILKVIGLPKLINFRSILFDLTDKKDVDRVVIELETAAKYNLLATIN